MTNLKAKDIMSKHVVWITEDMSVDNAMSLFIEEMISGAPVVDDDGNMTGVVSMRDFLKNGSLKTGFSADREEAIFYNESWELPISREEASSFHLETGKDLKVSEVMTPIVFNADVETPVEELAETMLKGRIHRMVILDGDELAGLVTTMDMLKVICHSNAEV